LFLLKGKERRGLPLIEIGAGGDLFAEVERGKKSLPAYYSRKKGRSQAIDREGKASGEGRRKPHKCSEEKGKEKSIPFSFFGEGGGGRNRLREKG